MEILKDIKRDGMIWKFSFYGLLKNLKFFEPYLVLYLVGAGLSLFEIGILYAIREFVTYLFEVPSGIIADHYGKKNELMLCFIFYIGSFFMFFIGGTFWIFSVAMFLFGLGEAFRSGTHKSMILSYLEQRGWFDHKTFVYGRTRSFSLFGSSVSSFLSVLLVINLPATRWIFLMTTIPYIADFLLILSYPDSLNERSETEISLRQFLRLSVDSIRSIFRQRFVLKVVMSSATFDGLFKTVKDYIQPIMIVLLALESEMHIKIGLGILYGIFYIFSSIASRNVYRLRRRADSSVLMNASYLVLTLALALIATGVWQENLVVTVSVFFVIYVLKDVRRPVFVDLIGDYMAKKQRATVLSVESQVRAILVMVMAPLFGLISDLYGIAVGFAVFAGVSLGMMALLRLARPEAQ